MSNFNFLTPQFSAIHTPAKNAERYIDGDPRAAAFYARRAVEGWVNWLYQHDNTLRRPEDEDNLATLLGRYDFQRAVPRNIRDKAHLIRTAGNQAVHDHFDIRKPDALNVVKELFQLLRWHAHAYGDPAQRDVIPASFDNARVPRAPERIAIASIEKLRETQAQMEAQDKRLRETQSDNENLLAEIAAYQAQIAAFKEANEVSAESQTYSEADTRKTYIDTYLREAGWNPYGENVAEYKVSGYAGSVSGVGKVDYVLWDDTGLPLAVVEAKRTLIDAVQGRQQAKLYADALEAETAQRPVIFYTNGYEIYIWDDAAGSGYPPRQIQGFYTREGLRRLMGRRSVSADALTNTPVNAAISGRPYQKRAIKRVTERFAARHRKALLHMATGTGKTRTTIGLVDVMLRAGWAMRVLFLADRTALVKQAERAFRDHLPGEEPVNLLDLASSEKETARNARILVSTYHSIINRLDTLQASGEKAYSVGHFDLIVIDEAHRSVFRKFRAIFDYFDSHLLGLTATPRDEIDRNTYELFGLETGVPTDSYDLTEAVADGWLVPPVILDIPSLIMRRGLRYDQLSEEEQARWDEIDWGEGGAPEEVGSAEINKTLFNKDTVDQVLARLMLDGLHVAGGDRLGKTIIFARNQKHAEFIEERFNAAYPHYAGHFARVVSYREPKSQTIIDDFKEADSPPHIAISVDMLDTGIDVPEVVNLVFFKPVYSRTKYEQMIGRGTRLCPDLFGPGKDKRDFYIFDLCANAEYFKHEAEKQQPRTTPPLRQRIFEKRLQLIDALDNAKPLGIAEARPRYGGESGDLIGRLRDQLHARVAGMPQDNFIVRTEQEMVERLADRAAWDDLGAVEMENLHLRLGNLPSSADANEREEAKRFDLLILQLQLALLTTSATYATLSQRVQSIASRLETAANIPMVADQLPLIVALQSDAWWQDVTVEMLESVREKLRGLVHLMAKEARTIVYTDFADTLGEAKVQHHAGFAAGVDRIRYRQTVEQFIGESEQHPVMQKIINATPLTEADIVALENYFYSADVTRDRAVFESVYGAEQHLGELVRSVTGIDRAVAKRIFERYLDDKRFSAQQINFVNHIINHLTIQGNLTIDQLYEPPFTDFHSQGLDGLFGDDEADRLFERVVEIAGAIRPIA